MWSQKNYYDGTRMEYQLNVMVKKNYFILSNLLTLNSLPLQLFKLPVDALPLQGLHTFRMLSPWFCITMPQLAFLPFTPAVHQHLCKQTQFHHYITVTKYVTHYG